MKTPIPSKIIPSGDHSRAKEEAVFGEYAANRYQSLLFRLMDQFSVGAYNGGIWELHEFKNGAVMWIFPDDEVIQTRTLNGYDPECSMRTLSMAINVIVLSALMAELAQNGSNDQIVERMIKVFDADRDVGYALADSKSFISIID